MALHKLFGKILATFQYGTSLRRTDNRNILCALVVLEVVVYTLYQWIFWSYYNHVDTILYCEVFEFIKLVDSYGYVFSTVACTCIAWSNKEFLYFLALSDFPCQGVLTATAS